MSKAENKYSLEYAKYLDSKDPLSKFKKYFVINDADLIYLDGNSLGRLPKNTLHKLQDTISYEWGDKLIQSWNDAWYLQSQKTSLKIAKLIGARENEVIIADSTSVNLFKLAYAALLVKSDKTNIISVIKINKFNQNAV